MAGDWVFVAILEAAAFKRFQTVIPVRPQAPVQQPARPARVEHTSVMPPPQPAAVPEAPEEFAQDMAPRSRFARLPRSESSTALRAGGLLQRFAAARLPV